MDYLKDIQQLDAEWFNAVQSEDWILVDRVEDELQELKNYLKRGKRPPEYFTSLKVRDENGVHPFSSVSERYIRETPEYTVYYKGVEVCTIKHGETRYEFSVQIHNAAKFAAILDRIEPVLALYAER